MESKLFNPGFSFFNLSIVRYTIFIFVVVIVMISLLILISENLNFCFKADCFAKFASLLKVPFAGLAVLGSILALYATNHRSEQAKENMRLSTVQNNFSNYYKHIEEFEKYVEKIKNNNISLFRGLVVDSRSLYSVLFPESHSGNMSMSYLSLEVLNNSFSKIIDSYLDMLNSNNFQKSILFFMADQKEACFFHFKHSIKYEEKENYADDDDDIVLSTDVAYEGRTYLFDGTNVEHFMWRIVNFFTIYNTLMKFDINYSSEKFDSKVDQYKHIDGSSFIWHRITPYKNMN